MTEVLTVAQLRACKAFESVHPEVLEPWLPSFVPLDFSLGEILLEEKITGLLYFWGTDFPDSS